jgi:hypothetical protein
MDDTGRAHEEDIFSMIRSPGNLEELHDESLDDGSQYLCEYGDGLEAEEEQIIFQNPLHLLTMSGEVYVLASGDHYICIN